MKTFLLIALKLKSARYSFLEVWVLLWTASFIARGEFWSAGIMFVVGVVSTAIAKVLVRRLS